MNALRVGITVLLLAAPLSATAETVLVEADRDATLIQDPDGALGNGSGPVFFVGRTNQGQNSVRRALLRFDVAAALPRNARVLDARLTLHMTSSNPTPRVIGLHRVLADWGEGNSYAAGGSGDDAAPGDATWIHTFFDDAYWVSPGGQFVTADSGAREVGSSGFYTWEGTPKMAADVRMWLAAPHRNFGWVLIGDETTAQNVKSFASREESDPALRPALEITYSLPGR
ncbi:MAG: DNRLRE domain-containing protein [Acidobacteriota bacterium]|jgi:hypothetical protein